MIPHRSVQLPPSSHDPKAVWTSAAKLAALVATLCLAVALIASGVLVVVVLQLGGFHH
jgi:hypothetical protein